LYECILPQTTTTSALRELQLHMLLRMIRHTLQHTATHSNTLQQAATAHEYAELPPAAVA